MNISSKFGLTRRSFLTALGAGTATAATWGTLPLAQAKKPSDSSDPWDITHDILKRVRPPRFPQRKFDITDFGAIGDGVTDCTAAIAAAIDACHKARGGRVYVPTGKFLTGAIHLKSNVNLNVSKKATLLFSTDPNHYLPVVLTRWEGNDCYNYSPLIYAYQQTNVAVTGKGLLDGQASLEYWWPWKQQTQWGWKEGDPGQNADTKQLRTQGGAIAPFTQEPVENRVYGAGHYLRPAFVEFYECENVLIQGITITRSPFWLLHPVFCTSVTIRDYTAASLGTNNDGCDPESCTDVVIENCTFDTGDDCVAIKAGRGLDGLQSLLYGGKPTPCQNIVVRNCRFANGHGGFTIGSEMSGGVINAFGENLLMSSEELDIAVRFKTNSYRGGTVENIHVRDVEVPSGTADRAVSIDYFYEEGAGGPFKPVVREVSISNMTTGENDQADSDNDDYAIYLSGYPDNPIGHVEISDSSFYGRLGNFISNAPDVVFRDAMVNDQPVT
ncbi:MAG: glycoside hydrolase family 28 protein [Candidatus Competibacter denitrificans]